VKKMAMAMAGSVVLMASALAMGPRGHHGDHGEHPEPTEMVERMDEHLDLSDDQEATLLALFEERQAGAGEQHDALRSAQERVRGLVEADAPDHAQVRSAMQEVANLRVELEFSRFETMQSVRAVLTPEQREKARSHHERRRDHHGSRGGH